MLNFELRGNYIVLTDTTKPRKEFTGLAKNVVITKDDNLIPNFYIEGLEDWSEITAIPYSRISGFSSINDFIDWYSENTGEPPQAGATSALQTVGNTILSNLLTELQLKADLIETQPVSVTNLPSVYPINDNGGSITVDANDLDIRNLVFSNDKVDASGSSVNVVNFPTTQPVSATSLPLPTGASTATLQTTGNTSLSSIDGKLSTIEAILNNLSLKGRVSTNNNYSSTIASLATQSGLAEEVVTYPSIVCAILSDQDGAFEMQLSTDGVTWQSTLSFPVIANTSEVHGIRVTRRYFRFRFTNTSGVTANVSVQTIFGAQTQLTSALNSIVQQDADASVTRSIDAELLIAGNYLNGFSIVNKFGTNSDIDTGSIPEDITEIGGTYTGFPDTTLETISISSTSALDTLAGTGARQIRINGLDTNYNQISEVINLNGLTPVTSVNQYRRSHTMQVISVGSTGVNQGTITATHTTTTTNVFCSIQIGRNQSNMSGYTVPAGYTAYMRFLHCSLIQGTAFGNAKGTIWTRAFGMPFRGRRPFFVSTNYRLTDKIYGGLVFTEKSDIILRINSVSNNNTEVSGGYDLILIKNT